MAGFVCKNCNYRFKSEKINEICPYCGKKELIKEPSAEDLLKEE
tara:strand:- start:20071 stop:20202 length:132 start_codon:yes stop_codon:yes gene_type:complete